MSNVRRVYVEKKPAFAVQAKELKHEVSSYLGIKSVTAVDRKSTRLNSSHPSSSRMPSSA